MTFFQPVRPGAWGKFSTPSVINKTVISGSFNNYSSGFGCGMPTMGGFGVGMPMMGGYTMDYGCCGGGGWKSFLGGFFGGFLGGLFGGGGNSSAVGLYGGGGGGTTGGAAGAGGNEVDGLQKLLGKDYNVSFLNGEYAVKDKDGNILTGKTPQDIIDQINGGADVVDETDEGDGSGKTIKGKAQLQEECDTFNGKYSDKDATLEVITDPNDANFGEYKLSYKDKDGNPKTETVKTVLEAQQLLNGQEVVHRTEEDEDDPTLKDGGDGGKKSGDVADKAAFDDVFSKLPDGYKYENGKGVVGPDGSIYKNPASLLAKLSEGNVPILSEGFDISTLDGANIIAHDHGEPKDITGDVSVNTENKTITINGHTYNIVENGGEFIYFNDPEAKNSNGSGQTYILEKTAGGDYRLSQYDFLKRTDADDGYNVAAH